MIRLDKIGKQNGRQIVFIEASAALQKGEKAGLVGPNGAGKRSCPSMRWKFGVELERPSVRRPEVELL